MKNSPFLSGIIAVVSPLPMFVFTILWCWFCFFGIALGLMEYEIIPLWIDIVGIYIPLCISPMLGVCAFVHSIVKRKQKLAWLGCVLSFVCLVENALLIFGMVYVGTRY